MKKQFISGARCPKCQQLDTIVRITDGSNIRYQCVECGFYKAQNDMTETSSGSSQAVKKITIKGAKKD